MKVSDFFYELPESQIAQEPLAERDAARLLIVDSHKEKIVHRHFRDLVHYVYAGDVLVLNATKVFPARLRGRKKTGGKVEVLLLDRSNDGNVQTWRALVRGTTSPTSLEFPGGLTAVMTQRMSEGEWQIQFSDDVRPVLERYGEMPLPPYIKRAQAQSSDHARYQTVFAKEVGAVAAPTAGFHFTPALLERLRAKGIQILEIVLHVGWGTFRPLRSERVEDHQMLPERYAVSEPTAAALNAARQKKQRIIAVGTTAVRTLESICDDAGRFQAGNGATNLFIYPGYHFKAIDALITNFHLPDSTPLLLASAFYSAKKKDFADPFSLRAIYQEAIREKYRFYSYGDAMFIQ